MIQFKKGILSLFVALCLLLAACEFLPSSAPGEPSAAPEDTALVSAGPIASSGQNTAADADHVPPFSTQPYVTLNGNQPNFTEETVTTTSFEQYSPLDHLGRCGVAVACIGTDLMPTQERGSIGQVKPSGWHTVKYDIVDGKYLYNRCHLIGYQLSGENANECNLITGTRYMNVEGMLPFENMVADYVRETENHVMYRVTPYYEGDNLLANGVQIEALSVEDGGDGIMFNVYVYNSQPGIEIDYATGESWLEDESDTQAPDAQTSAAPSETGASYVLNTNTKVFHTPDCASAAQTSEKNRQTFTGSRDELMAQGYEPCGRCKP